MADRQSARDLRSYVVEAPDGLPAIIVRSDKEYIAALEADVERLERERDDLREVLDRLTEALGNVRVSGMAARTFALHEAWKAAREALDA